MPYRVKLVWAEESGPDTQYEDLEDKIAEIVEPIPDGNLVSVSHGYGNHGSFFGTGTGTLTAVIVWWED